MNEVLNAIAAYGPGVVALIGAVVASVIDIKRTRKIVDFKIEENRKLHQQAYDSLFMKYNDMEEQNRLLDEIVAEMREENKMLRKSLDDLSQRLTHVEFIDK